ncbi:MAG: exodeoxyribonuclease III [bacterium]|nr:exodeoxyribonuclease III [bacterium]
MRLVTWNVNGIRARLERVRAWIGEHGPDVLCLQETKIADDAFPHDAFTELGYYVAIHGQRSWNGVAILSRTPLDAVQRGFDDGVEDAQARLIAATTGGVRVVSAYVPNGETIGSDKYAFKLAWMTRLGAWLRRIVPETPRLALCGDFNVAPAELDVHDPARWIDTVLFTPEVREALETLRQDAGLVDVVRRLNPGQPCLSWWDYRMLAFPKGRGLRIDHIFLTPALDALASAAGVDRNARKGAQPSDHAPVWVELRRA